MSSEMSESDQIEFWLLQDLHHEEAPLQDVCLGQAVGQVLPAQHKERHHVGGLDALLDDLTSGVLRTVF